MAKWRRFPPPWSVEELDACYVVRDHNGQSSRTVRTGLLILGEEKKRLTFAATHQRQSVHCGFIFKLRKFDRPGGEVTMKSPLVIVLVAVVLVTVGTMAVMNKACKSSQHAWCAPMSTVRHHIKIGHG